MLFNAVSRWAPGFYVENYSPTRYYLRALHIIWKICDIWRRSFPPSINLADENWFAFRKRTIRPSLYTHNGTSIQLRLFVGKIQYEITSCFLVETFVLFRYFLQFRVFRASSKFVIGRFSVGSKKGFLFYNFI